MNKHEGIFAYKKESAQGLIDKFDPDTRVLVTIKGRGQMEMTLRELSRQIETLRAEDIGQDAIEKIEVCEVSRKDNSNLPARS
jgi:hypothetical protein